MNNHTDRLAVEAVYNATDGPHWLDNDNWLTDAPLADWHGVSVDAYGRVFELDLEGNCSKRPAPARIGSAHQSVRAEARPQ